MTRHRLTIRVDNNIAIVRGWKASGVLRSAGLRPTYSGTAGGWMVDVSQLPELVAWLEYRNLAYALEDHHTVRPDQDRHEKKISPEPQGLW